MNQADAKEQLMYLRGLTIRLGSIHEAQRVQFTNWPKLVPGVSTKKEDVEARVDYDNHVVYIHTKAKKKPFRPTKEARRWVWKVAFWTNSILWPDTRVVFKVDGKIIEPLEPEDVKR